MHTSEAQTASPFEFAIANESQVPFGPVEFSKAYDDGFFLTVRFLCSRGASLETAEEVAQAAWTRGWQCRSQLLDRRKVGYWVNSIAKNLFHSQVLQQQRFECLSDTPVQSAHDQKLDMAAFMGTCSETEVKMLSLYYLEGYTALEIARLENMCPATVRVRLMRIRDMLRTKFQLPNAKQKPPAQITQ